MTPPLTVGLASSLTSCLVNNLTSRQKPQNNQYYINHHLSSGHTEGDRSSSPVVAAMASKQVG